MTDTYDQTTAVADPTPRKLPIWVIILAFIALIGFMALIAWGLNRSMRGALAVGDPVSFSMTTFDEKPINTADYKGQVIVINFWASWCQPCELEAAELQEAYMHYKDGGQVAFLGLAYVDTEPKSLGYLKKFGITYPNGPDLQTKVSQMFRIRGVPETYVIDQQGRLAYMKIGPFSSTQEIISAVDNVLNK